MTPTERHLVLIIDDDPEARAAMRLLLGQAGHDVVEASDGRKAIHYLTASVREPSLIVADLAMPDMNGWELINVLQAYGRLSCIPIVVVSGMSLNQHPHRDEGVLEFFSKPVDAERFLTAVDRHALSTAERKARWFAASEKLARRPF